MVLLEEYNRPLGNEHDSNHQSLGVSKSHSSEDSFENIAPSVSATSAGSSDADETMATHTSITQDMYGFDRDMNLNLAADSNSESGNERDGRPPAGAVPSNVSVTSNDDDDFHHSGIHDHWETADEYDCDCTNDSDDSSRDSFGPRQLDGHDCRNMGRSSDSGGATSRKANSLSVNIYPSLSVSFSSEGNSSTCSLPSSPSRRQISVSLSIPPQSPIPQFINNKKRQARAALVKHNVKFKNRIQRFKKARAAKPKSRIIVIPSNHRFKIMWDTMTIALTFVSAYVGHIYIRDRSTYEWDWFVLFTNVWFFVDVMLNFFTEHRTADGTVMRSGREVWGRYLTTWFAVDALSLLPWERMFLRPIIQMQKRRNVVVKWFFRGKATIKITVSLLGLEEFSNLVYSVATH